MNNWLARLNSLPVRMIISFVGLALLTAIAAGVPAIWLLNRQLEQQAWAQVEQGSRAAQALYTAANRDMANLATLTAQRPTLSHLLAQKDRPALDAYLQTLKDGADLDLVLVCQGPQLLGQAGPVTGDELCLVSGFQMLTVETIPAVWLLQRAPIAAAPETVIVGLALNDEFARRMQLQTGLEHTLLADHRPVTTSLPGGLPARRATPLIPRNNLTRRGTMQLDGTPYYTLHVSLAAAPPHTIIAEMALPVTNIATTQQNLRWTLLVGIVVVALLGSGLGILLARHISRPLDRLTRAAATLSQGNLSRSVLVDTTLREVALVGAALEAARVDLNLTLGDLRREKAWTDHLLDAIVEGIVMLDRQNQLVFFSRGAERITGWTHDEVLGRPVDEIFQTIETDQPFSRLLTPPRSQHKIAVSLRNGRQAMLSVTSAPLMIPDESKARQVLVFRDVSETEAMHRLIGHFMANITHEFRTPLSSLAASVELLLDQAPDLSPAELQELITSLRLGIVGLQTLVDNLLEGASIETGRFRVYARPVELSRIIQEAANIMTPLLTKYGQRLTIDLPVQMPLVLADHRRTVQVLVNLLSNAGKYGPDDAEIELSVAGQGEQVQISVADRGPGIPAAHHAHLFSRFFLPAKHSDKSQYGAGLGLSVVKAIVEAQGGQVGVEDRPGGGSVFWFTLRMEHSK